jgi:hypothetical protein
MAFWHKPNYAFIGMEGSKIWKLLNIHTLSVEKYGDAAFNEYKLPLSNYKLPSDSTQDILIRPVTGSGIQLQRHISQGRAGGSDQNQAIGSGSNPTATGRAAGPSNQLGTSDGLNSSGTGPSVSDQTSAPVRPGKLSKGRVFNETVAQLAFAVKAVHLSDDDTTSLGVPTAPFEAIELDVAMREDAPGWHESILEEYRGLQKMNAFTIKKGKPPPGRKLIPSRLVLKKKFNTKGETIRLKSRLCARGDKQEAGVDYFQTFASVMRFDTLRAILAKAAAEDWEIDHIDVDQAFLNPTLKEDIYMTIPPYLLEMLHPQLLGEDDLYLKLNKSMYGLRQAPREWFIMVKEFFDSVGLSNSQADPNLFSGRGIFLPIFVDDMLTIGPRADVDKVKQEIYKRWKCKDLGPADLFVGFQIERNRKERSLKIHQTFYIKKLLQRLKMESANPVRLPIPAGTVLKSDPENLLIGDDVIVYQQVVGSVIYIANCTRPDISYAVGQLARFMASPGLLYYKMAKQLVRYLKGTITIGILYLNRLGCGSWVYDIYTDATWGTEDDRISFQGMVVIKYGGAITWAAQRQKSIALSSMEAEIMASSEGGKEAAWLEKLATDLGERDATNPYVPTLHCDNQGAVDLLHDTKFHRKAKHIEIRYMFLRTDMVNKGRLKVRHIPGHDQPADVLTKQLPVDDFTRHCKAFGLSP